jgi:hypothetical protein
VLILLPMSCANPWSESRNGFGGVDPRVVVHPKSPGPTGLTDASHRSDWCRPQLGFARVNVLVSSPVSCVAVVSSLVHVGAREVRFADLGFLGSNRSDRSAAPA